MPTSVLTAAPSTTVLAAPFESVAADGGVSRNGTAIRKPVVPPLGGGGEGERPGKSGGSNAMKGTPNASYRVTPIPAAKAKAIEGETARREHVRFLGECCA
jgi:hypothetical protein